VSTTTRSSANSTPEQLCFNSIPGFTVRADPLFKLAAGRAPLETGNPLACDATHSRLEGSLRRSDIYRAPEH